MTDTYKLTYFNIWGVAEKVRLAFVLNGIAFTDERLTSDEWKERKPSSKFGQLPLMSINGGEPIAQSPAMLQHVGRLNGGKLYPAENQTNIDEMVCLAMDFDRAFGPALSLSLHCTSYGFPEGWNKTDEGIAWIKRVREDFVANKLPTLIGHYDRELSKTGAFLCGTEPTIADCWVFVQLKTLIKGHLSDIPTTCLDAYPNIQAYLARFAAIPEVARWYAPK